MIEITLDIDEIRRAQLIDLFMHCRCAPRDFASRLVGSYLQDRGTQVCLALENNAALGFCVLDIYSTHSTVDYIGVAESHKRRGIGCGLLDCALELSIENTDPFVQAGDGATNIKSRGLFEKKGFSISQDHGSWYMMVKQIKQ